MARLVTIGGGGALFVGEDKVLRFELLEHGVPVDAAGHALLFDVRRHDDAPTFIVQKQPTVVGVFNLDRATNTQRIQVVLDHDDMNRFAAHTYRYSLKRMSDGIEAVLFWGDFAVEQATAR
jgi:hypothetical protein